MTSKKKGKTYKVIKEDAYWRGDDPVKVGSRVTLDKTQAKKLISRGIVEE